MSFGILPGYDPPEPPENYERCPECGGDCYEVDNQGHGLVAYECLDCRCHFQVQYEWDSDLPDEEYFEDVPF